MEKKSVIKVKVSRAEAQMFRRKFPRGAMQKIARAAWNGHDAPLVAAEEQRNLAAIEQRTAYVTQQLEIIIDLLPESFPIDTRPAQDPSLQKLETIFNLLSELIKTLGLSSPHRRGTKEDL